MRKPDIMSVLVISILAGVVLTMFVQGGGEPISSAQASESYTASIQGWGTVRPYK